jgi:hypothetical protein
MEGGEKENQDPVKSYILAKPEAERTAAYKELVGFLLPEEESKYKKDVNDPASLGILSLGLQRKENLEAILNKKNIPDKITEVINNLPSSVLTGPTESLMPFLSPLEQKVFYTAAKTSAEDVDDFLVKQSLLAIAFNRSKEEKRLVDSEISPSDPDSVKKYIAAQPAEKRGDAYMELVDALIPEERRLYNQADINGPESLRIVSLGLQRKNNLEAILNKKNIPENLKAIIAKAPTEIVSQPTDKLIPFLSPLEQKVLSAASNSSAENVEDFLVKQSILALAFDRSLKK